jgi:hypothetical protein
MKQLLVVLALAVTAWAAGQDPANFWVKIEPTAEGTAEGFGHGACHVRYMGATANTYGTLQVKCLHDITLATMGHIHIGAAGTSGGVKFTFANKGLSPIMYTSAALDKELEDALFKDSLYVNVHTEKSPGGAGRGQIMKGTSGTYYADLDNAQEGGSSPPTTGTAGVGWVKRIVGTTNTWEAEVWHNIGNSTWGGSAGHIHGPSSGPGNSTGVVYAICGTYTECASSTKGVKKTISETNAGHWTWAKMGLLYFNIHNKAKNLPNGEIRGQIMPAMDLTQFMRSGAASTTVGVSVIAAICLTLFARLL